MIRKMLGLALEAAKEEIRIWKNPAPMLPEPAVETPPVDEVVEVSVTSAVTTLDLSSWRRSTKGHTETLASTKCACGADKNKGDYFCQPCIDARKDAS